jgi:hypothetical protein
MAPVEHKERVRILLEILRVAQRDLDSEHSGQRRMARRLIDEYWHASAADDEPLHALVNALEQARLFQQPADGTSRESLLERAAMTAPSDQRSAMVREAVLGVAMLCFPATSIPPRDLLWSAIENWTQKNTRGRWPAVYALAKSIGIRKKPATLQREVKRILSKDTRRK